MTVSASTIPTMANYKAPARGDVDASCNELRKLAREFVRHDHRGSIDSEKEVALMTQVYLRRALDAEEDRLESLRRRPEQHRSRRKKDRQSF